jgi:hypothetical protein
VICVESRQQKERCVIRFQTRFFLVLALVTTVCTPLPRTVAPQTRATGAPLASGDAVIVWNANAGVAAKPGHGPLYTSSDLSRLNFSGQIPSFDKLKVSQNMTCTT